MRLYPKFAVHPAIYSPDTGRWIVDVYGRTSYHIEEEGYSKVFLTTLTGSVKKRIRGYRFVIEIRKPQLKTVELLYELNEPIRVKLFGGYYAGGGIPMLTIPEEYYIAQLSDDKIKLVSAYLLESRPHTYFFGAKKIITLDEPMTVLVLINFLGGFDLSSDATSQSNLPPFAFIQRDGALAIDSVNITTKKTGVTHSFTIPDVVEPIDLTLPEPTSENLNERWKFIPARRWEY